MVRGVREEVWRNTNDWYGEGRYVLTVTSARSLKTIAEFSGTPRQVGIIRRVVRQAIRRFRTQAELRKYFSDNLYPGWFAWKQCNAQ